MACKRMISTKKKNKAGKEKRTCWVLERSIGILHRMVMEASPSR